MGWFRDTPIKWISHRGYCAQHIENTEAAFRAAEAVGFKAIETDLRLTKDHHIVLSHDESLERLLGKSIEISESTRDELEAIRFSDGTSLFFLDQLLDKFSHLQWTFDIKEPGGLKTLEHFNQMIEMKKLKGWVESHVTFLVWSASLEKKLKLEYPTAQFYARMEECKRAGLASISGLTCLSGIKKEKIYAVSKTYCGLNFFSSSIVSKYHQKGVKILAFLPANPIEARQAQRAGFDEILSDHPPLDDHFA